MVKERIKAFSTVIIKFIICRNISGYEHGAGYCTSKMEIWLATEDSSFQKTYNRELVKNARRVKKVLERQQQFQNSSHGTLVSTAPGYLSSQSTNYCPYYLAFSRQSQCAHFPLDSSADYVVEHPLISFLVMYQISCLSFLRYQIILSILAAIQHLQKRSIYSRNESTVNIAVQFLALNPNVSSTLIFPSTDGSASISWISLQQKWQST